MSSAVLVVIPLLFLLAPRPVCAAGFSWEFYEADARSEALAGADLALAGGPGAHLFNAAPLQTGDPLQVGFSHREWFVDQACRYASVAREWKDLRLGFTWANLYMDPMAERTAYAPEGTGRFFDIDERVLIFGLSYDLVRWITPDREGLHWIVGANYRDYNARMDRLENGIVTSTRETDTGAIDAGMTASWRREVVGGWEEASVALTVHDVFGNDYHVLEFPARLYQHLRGGMALRRGWRSDADKRLSTELSLLYMRIENLGPSSDGGRNTHNFAVEAVLCDYVALRVGNRIEAGTFDSGRWGFGIRTPCWLWSRGGVSVDYSTLGTWRGVMEQWTITGRLDI